jgi:hypothetical protein
MNIYSQLYLLTRLDGIKDTLLGITIFAFIIAAIMVIFIFTDEERYWMNKEDINRREAAKNIVKKHIKIVFPICILSLLLNVLIPTRNEAVFIVAGGKTIDYIKSDTTIQKLPQQATILVSEYLNKQIEEINKNPKENK